MIVRARVTVAAAHDQFERVECAQVQCRVCGIEPEIRRRTGLNSAAAIDGAQCSRGAFRGGTQRVCLMASSEGGMDIEEVAAHTPEKIHKVFVDPGTGLKDAEADDVARKIGIPEASIAQARAALQGLYKDVSGYLSTPSDEGNYALKVGTGGYASEIAKGMFRAVSATAVYNPDDKMTASIKGEVRFDDGNSADGGDQTAYYLAARLSNALNADWRVLAALDAVVSDATGSSKVWR